MLCGERILQKRPGYVKGNKRDFFEKNCYVRLLGKPYFYFKRKRDKETYGINRKYINYGAGNNRYSTVFILGVKYPFRDFLYRKEKELNARHSGHAGFRNTLPNTSFC
jgi:hypothetical protein